MHPAKRSQSRFMPNARILPGAAERSCQFSQKHDDVRSLSPLLSAQ